MLKIKSRIALLYSLLTIFFILILPVLFYMIFSIYADIRPVMQSISTDISKSYVDNSKFLHSNSKITKNYIYITSKDGTLEKSKVYEYVNNKRGLIVGYANVGYGGLNEGDIGDVYKTKKGNGQYKYTQNYLITEFDEKNNVINSNIIPDELLKENLQRDQIINSKNKILLKDFLRKHNSGKIEVVTDKHDNVIGSKILKRYYGTNYSDSRLKNNLEEFESEILHILYERAVYIVIALILMVIVINFILSKRYAVFALKPLIEFTGKVKEQGEFKGIKLIDMPEVKDEIYDLTYAYNEAMGKVKKSYENLQRLNSYASHELRNSLAVLRGKVEMGEDTREITTYIDKLTGVTNDILAMSTSKLCDGNEKVDLALICAKVVDDYLEIFKNIELKLPEDGVNLIKGKEMWIERCVINLMDNAIKFADKNKQDNKIVVEVCEDDSKAVIEVWDNGIGVEKNKMEEIFKPYYGTNSRVSTGIGLAYVKHVMELHGGKVTVQSRQGEYSKFLLTFYKE